MKVKMYREINLHFISWFTGFEHNLLVSCEASSVHVVIPSFRAAQRI